MTVEKGLKEPLKPPDVDLDKQEVFSVSVWTWLRVLCLWAASVVCGGVSPGQAVFTELFRDAGLFAGVCEAANVGAPCDAQFVMIANVMTTTGIVLLLWILPCGMLFDSLGGRVIGVVGAIILAVGIGLLICSLSMSNVVLFTFAVCIADFGSLLQNFAFYSFLFHLPGWQALLIAMSNGCTQVACVLPVVLQSLMRRFSMSLLAVLGLYALAVSLGACVNWAAVPSQSEYLAQAQLVLGMPLPPVRPSWRRFKRSMSEGRRILQKDAWQHTVVGSLVVAGIVSILLYMSFAEPFGARLFNDEAAGDALGGVWSWASALTGLIVVPLTGAAADLAGLPALAASIALSLLGVQLFVAKPLWWAQWVSTLCAAFFYNGFLVFILRYVVLFAPADRFGAVQGLFTAGIFVGILPFVVALNVWYGSDAGEIALWKFLFAVRVFGSAACVGWAAYYVRMRRRPLPELVLLPEDEQDIMQRFQVRCLADAEEVMDLSRAELLRRLASGDVLVQRALLQLAESEAANTRYRALARRRAGELKQEPLPHINVKNGEVVICSGTLDEVWEAAASSFQGGQGERGEPIFTWLTHHLPEDSPLKRQLARGWLGILAHAGCRFGHGLVLKAGSKVEAVCVCYPPSRLGDGDAVPLGGDRWLYGFHHTDEKDVDGDLFGMQRNPELRKGLVTLVQFDMSGHHKEQPPHWYINVLGVVPGNRGKRRAKMLLEFVMKMADEDGVGCYLECGLQNIPIYEKCGYHVVWQETAAFEGERSTTSGMFRPCSSR